MERLSLALIKEKCIEFAVEQICGLPSDGNTKELVISKYKNIIKS